MKKRKFGFYTLFYMDERYNSISHNLTGNFEQQLITFVKCCQTLDRSLRWYTDSRLTVLTNNESFVRRYAPDLQVKEIDFSLNLPEGLSFFASHHKLDVYKFFARRPENEYMFLLDNDMVCINQMPLNLANCIEMKIPVYYDITQQAYPGAGRDVIIRDKQFLMNGAASTGIWAGGEFIGGDNKFFRSLREEIDKIIKPYLANYKMFHHQGDELIVSVALEQIMKQRNVQNAGVFGGVGRFWGCSTAHVQMPIDAFDDHFLFHLPADKEYLASADHACDSFFSSYKRYLQKKKMSPIRMLKGLYGKIKSLMIHANQ